VDNRLSAMLLDGRLGPGQHVTVAAESADAGALEFRVSERAPEEPAPAD
jgi:hypothetical protein